MPIIYENDRWQIYENNGCLRITYFEDNHYVEELTVTPEIMRSKFLDVLKEMPEEVWAVR